MSRKMLRGDNDFFAFAWSAILLTRLFYCGVPHSCMRRIRFRLLSLHTSDSVTSNIDDVNTREMIPIATATVMVTMTLYNPWFLATNPTMDPGRPVVSKPTFSLAKTGNVSFQFCRPEIFFCRHVIVVVRVFLPESSPPSI